MKNIFLIAIFSMLFCSCTTFIPTDSEYDLWFAIKKVDGKEQWGVVRNKNIRGWYNVTYEDGKYIGGKATGYIHFSRDEKLDLSHVSIDIKYDSIKFVDFHGYNMFFAYKDEKTYYYGESFMPFADNKPVERLEYISPGVGKCFNNKIEAKFYVEDDIVYTTRRGPVEDIEVGFWGYALKYNGKWGYYFGRLDIKNNAGSYFTQIIPFSYDEIIESLDMKYMKHLVFARQGDVWHIYNKKGEILPTDMKMINTALDKKKGSNYARPYFFSYAR